MTSVNVPPTSAPIRVTLASISHIPVADDGQYDPRGMLRVVVDALSGAPELAVLRHRPAGIRIAVETREAAARDLDADPVAGLEEVARLREVDFVPVDHVRLEQRGRCERVAVAGADDSVGEIPGEAVRLDVDELRRPVRVPRRRRRPQGDADRTGHLDVRGEGRRRVDEHVGTRLDAPLVERPAAVVPGRAAETAPASRDG